MWGQLYTCCTFKLCLKLLQINIFCARIYLLKNLHLIVTGTTQVEKYIHRTQHQGLLIWTAWFVLRIFHYDLHSLENINEFMCGKTCGHVHTQHITYENIDWSDVYWMHVCLCVCVSDSMHVLDDGVWEVRLSQLKRTGKVIAAWNNIHYPDEHH